MKLSKSLKYAIIIALTGTVVLFSVIYVEQKTIAVNNENQPLITLVEQVKTKSVNAHFWFEKMMEKENSFGLEKEMYESLDSTIKLFQQVFDGRETVLGSYHKTTNVKIYNTVNELFLNSAELKFLAEQRIKFRKNTLSKKNKTNYSYKKTKDKVQEMDGDIDQSFDESYEKLQGNYEHFATLIKMKIEQDNNILNNLFWATVLLISLVFATLSFLFYKTLKKEFLATNALLLAEKRFRMIFEKTPIDAALLDSISKVMQDVKPKYMEIKEHSTAKTDETNLKRITHPDEVKADKPLL